MKKTKCLLPLLVLTMAFQETRAQVKIGTTAGAPHSSAVLEVESTNKGLLLPRMTLAERGTITAPATGLTIYNTSLQCLEFYNGSKWGCLDFTPSQNAPALGSTFTAPHGVNAAAFSTNTACTSQLISAGHSAATCSGNLTVGSNTYPKVLVDGQCWMGKNLNEAPSNYPYTNTWLNTVSPADSSRWGYYNTTTTNGTAGFQATEPAAGEGLLYQWKAVMNGSTAERAQGACPAGWHVPSDCEWQYLEHGLGMTVAEQKSYSAWRSSGSVGQQLKSVAAGGTDTKGLTMLLAGYRSYSSGNFLNRNASGYLWCSSLYASDLSRAYYRGLDPGGDVRIFRGSQTKANAYSVRCLAD